MGQPRRRFPGGSVGKFIVIIPDSFKTEEEAIREAQALADKHGKRVYIAEYRNHVDPTEGSSA